MIIIPNEHEIVYTIKDGFLETAIKIKGVRRIKGARWIRALMFNPNKSKRRRVWAFACSECGRYSEVKHNWCPYCGEPMRNAEDEEFRHWLGEKEGGHNES